MTPEEVIHVVLQVHESRVLPPEEWQVRLAGWPEPLSCHATEEHALAVAEPILAAIRLACRTAVHEALSMPVQGGLSAAQLVRIETDQARLTHLLTKATLLDRSVLTSEESVEVAYLRSRLADATPELLTHIHLLERLMSDDGFREIALRARQQEREEVAAMLDEEAERHRKVFVATHPPSDKKTYHMDRWTVCEAMAEKVRDRNKEAAP